MLSSDLVTRTLRNDPVRKTCFLCSQISWQISLSSSTRPSISLAVFSLARREDRRFFQTASPLSYAKKVKMPPKKAGAPVEKTKLGRPSNNLKMGIVGLPNVGKSSLFNVIAKCDLGKSANFPYATIEPEEARVPVPDERFLWLVDQYKPKSQIPAFLTCIDIAGLTAGASTGAGLGNAFLSNVRAVDGIFQVVRAFDDAEVIHVEGDVNPLRDMDIISTELRLKDIEWVEKALEAAKQKARSAGSNSLEDKKKKEDVAIMEKVLTTLTEENKDVRKVAWNNKEVSAGASAIDVLFVDGWRSKKISDADHYMMTKGFSPILTQLFAEPPLQRRWLYEKNSYLAENHVAGRRAYSCFQ
jgi:50S ribosome-binding GTPase